MLFDKTERLVSKYLKEQFLPQLEMGVIETNKFIIPKSFKLDEFQIMAIECMFEKEYVENNINQKYFFGCIFNTAKNTYFARLEGCREVYPDIHESSFIYTEINNCLKKFNFPYIDETLRKNIEYSIERYEEFLKELLENIGYEAFKVKFDENGMEVPSWYVHYSVRKKNYFKGNNFVPYMDIKISQTQFMELFKSLYDLGAFPSINQKDALIHFCKLFNKKIYNPDKLLQDIKNRNIGSESLYIDKLKASLLEFINKEKKG